jgi:hypothetical protein
MVRLNRDSGSFSDGSFSDDAIQEEWRMKYLSLILDPADGDMPLSLALFYHL